MRRPSVLSTVSAGSTFPAIVGVAVLVALVPPLLFGQPSDIWIYRALALLLIGWPCALVISVSASIASAL